MKAERCINCRTRRADAVLDITLLKCLFCPLQLILGVVVALQCLHALSDGGSVHLRIGSVCKRECLAPDESQAVVGKPTFRHAAAVQRSVTWTNRLSAIGVRVLAWGRPRVTHEIKAGCPVP